VCCGLPAVKGIKRGAQLLLQLLLLGHQGSIPLALQLLGVVDVLLYAADDVGQGLDVGLTRQGVIQLQAAPGWASCMMGERALRLLGQMGVPRQYDNRHQ
jgi:hypothetical protein